MSIIPIDLTGAIHSALRESRREPDGLLHASGDLVSSLRHSQLALAGAPEVERGIAQDLRLETGTMWHDRIAEMLEATGVPFMQEIKLDAWLPEGWSGRADFILWDAEKQGWVLVDLKTCKGEGIEWIQRDGAKEAHLWQVSAYWYALLDAGFPMLDRFVVYYLPMNDVAGKIIEPFEAECAPVDRDELVALMNERWQRCTGYLQLMNDDLLTVGQRKSLASHGEPLSLAEIYANDALEPEQPRVQKMYWNKGNSSFEVKLVPHWSAQFCPYPDELCACDKAGVTKIGEWVLDAGEIIWADRPGYNVAPEIGPGLKDFAKKGVTV